MNEKDVYKFCLQKDIDLQYNKLSLANLYNYNIKRGGYQVHLDGQKSFSKIYRNIDDAINKFVELKNAKH